MRSGMIEVFREPVPTLDENNTTQCNRCNDPPVKRTKKSSTKNDFRSKKKQKKLSYNGVM